MSCVARAASKHVSLLRSLRLSLSWQSLKGTSGDVIVLEEAAYCEEGLVNEVIMPLLSMSQSVLLCISTLRESSNHYSKLFDVKDSNGAPIFEQMSISLVCEACMKTDHPERCTHKNHELPRWLSSDKVEIVRCVCKAVYMHHSRPPLDVYSQKQKRVSVCVADLFCRMTLGCCFVRRWVSRRIRATVHSGLKKCNSFSNGPLCICSHTTDTVNVVRGM